MRSTTVFRPWWNNDKRLTLRQRLNTMLTFKQRLKHIRRPSTNLKYMKGPWLRLKPRRRLNKKLLEVSKLNRKLLPSLLQPLPRSQGSTFSPLADFTEKLILKVDTSGKDNISDLQFSLQSQQPDLNSIRSDVLNLIEAQNRRIEAQVKQITD